MSIESVLDSLPVSSPFTLTVKVEAGGVLHELRGWWGSGSRRAKIDGVPNEQVEGVFNSFITSPAEVLASGLSKEDLCECTIWKGEEGYSVKAVSGTSQLRLFLGPMKEGGYGLE